MAKSVLCDNWSLQTVSELLTEGLDVDNSSLLEVSKDGQHSLAPVPSSILAFEALFDLINDVVLRDQILVDNAYTYTWMSKDGPFSDLLKSSTLRPFPFMENASKVVEPREAFVERLLLTPQLRSLHLENVAGWNDNKTTPYPLESQIIWGGAGMLARSFAFETPYTPHPTRKRFFSRAGIILPMQSAVQKLAGVVKNNRAAIRQSQSEGEELFSLRLSIDPIPVRVIREANSVSDILSIALQLRNEYQALRDWLGEFQSGLDDDKFNSVAMQEQLLKSVSLNVTSILGKGQGLEPTLSIGIDSFKLALKANPLNTIKNKYGVRSIINKLIFDANGQKELKRLLGFFGHHASPTSLKVFDHFGSGNKIQSSESDNG